ncbi:MAG: sigma factor [Nocardioidaceae bacterium]
MSSDEPAEAFEEERVRLLAVARRLLGSVADAEDAVQEAWLRLERHSAAGIDNLAGWLTTVVSRICLDDLRSRRNRTMVLWDEVSVLPDDGRSPDEARRARRVGPAWP